MATVVSPGRGNICGPQSIAQSQTYFPVTSRTITRVWQVAGSTEGGRPVCWGDITLYVCVHSKINQLNVYGDWECAKCTYTEWLSDRAACSERSEAWIQMPPECTSYFSLEKKGVCIVLRCFVIPSSVSEASCIFHSRRNLILRLFRKWGKVWLDHSPQINLLLSSQKTTLQQPVSG